jgi:hypothetical protein
VSSFSHQHSQARAADERRVVKFHTRTFAPSYSSSSVYAAVDARRTTAKQRRNNVEKKQQIFLSVFLHFE